MSFEPLTAERRRQQTREYLLEAAGRVFAERGFHGASLDEVAAAAGFTKGAVYSNFKNKDDLFLALIEAGYRREMQALHETIEGSEIPPQQRLGDFAGLIRNEMREVGDDWPSLYLEFTLYAMRHPEARARLSELEEQDICGVAELIEGNGTPPQGSAMTQARLVTALFRGLGLMRALDPERAGPELLEEAIAFAIRGLGEELPDAES